MLTAIITAVHRLRREVATFVIGKIRPLPQRELQRLGGMRRSWPGAAGAAGAAGRPGLLSSFLSLVDIDKQAPAPSTTTSIIMT